jgi:hypothetical protein
MNWKNYPLFLLFHKAKDLMGAPEVNSKAGDFLLQSGFGFRNSQTANPPEEGAASLGPTRYRLKYLEKRG